MTWERRPETVGATTPTIASISQDDHRAGNARLPTGRGDLVFGLPAAGVRPVGHERKSHPLAHLRPTHRVDSLRTPYGAGVRALEHHSESLEAAYSHVPGLKIVIPSTPRDTKDS